MSKSETYSRYCGWAVVFGLLIEIGLAFAFPKGNHWDTWLTIIADAFVAAGVWGEVHFSGKIAREADEANRLSAEKVAQANKIAEQARQRTAELEELTAYRHVPLKGRAALVEQIRNLSKSLDVVIEYSHNDAEAYSYFVEIAKLLLDAGVEKIRHAPNTMLAAAVFGVWIAGAEQMDVGAISEAFRRAAIPVGIFAKDLNAHFDRSVPPPNLYFFVAPKPPPSLDFGEAVSAPPRH